MESINNTNKAIIDSQDSDFLTDWGGTYQDL